MTYEIEIVDAVPQTIAAVRVATDLEHLPSVIHSSLDEVYAFLRAPAASFGPLGFNVVVYQDKLAVVDIGVILLRTFAPSGRILCSSTPAGPAATAAHFGRYSDIGAAHDAIRQWCADNMKTLAGPSWEVYGHWNDDWTKVRTDVYYLLTES